MARVAANAGKPVPPDLGPDVVEQELEAAVALRLDPHRLDVFTLTFPVNSYQVAHRWYVSCQCGKYFAGPFLGRAGAHEFGRAHQWEMGLTSRRARTVWPQLR